MANGLAASGQQQEIEMAVAEIIKMLQNGVSPNDLAQQGVPPELIELAMQQLSQMSQAPSGAPIGQPGSGMGTQEGLGYRPGLAQG